MGLGDGVFDLKAPTKNEADKVATVIIADGTRMDCYLLADAVQHNARLQVVGCVTSSTEVVNTVCKSQPDVALISTRLEDGPFAGLVALRKLRALRPRSRIIMLLDEGNSELVVEAFRNRARGIFCRTGAPADLRKCIQRVNEGQIWVNNTHSEYIVSAVMQAPPARVVQGRCHEGLEQTREGGSTPCGHWPVESRDIRKTNAEPAHCKKLSISYF